MSFESDITNIKKLVEDRPMFKPADDVNLAAREDLEAQAEAEHLNNYEKLPAWFSIRVVRAADWDKAVEEVEEGVFDENHPMCDQIVLAKNVVVDGEVFEAKDK